MHIYLKNNPAKFHPDPIWNSAALGFFEEMPNKNNKVSSDMRSVPDPKIDTTKQPIGVSVRLGGFGFSVTCWTKIFLGQRIIARK